jgi:ribosomal protein S6--L-glutamate ligase
MRLAVLASENSWYYADLKRAAGDRHELSCVSFRSLGSTAALLKGKSHAEPFQFGDTTIRVQSAGFALNEFDAILVRTMPPGTLEQVVFRMDALAQLDAAGILVVNSPRAIECCVDKYLTTARLAAAGLPVPPTIVSQTVEDGLRAFEALGGDVVLKPLFGGEGRGITRLTDMALAERAFGLLAGLGSVLYLQKYIDHDGADIRILLVGKHILAMRRVNHLDWRTNISRGAVAEAVEPRDEWVAFARRAADVVGATVAGVDLLTDQHGETYVIEVNAVPGWRAMTEVHQRDVAALVLSHVADAVKSMAGRTSQSK